MNKSNFKKSIMSSSLLRHRKTLQNFSKFVPLTIITGKANVLE